MSYKAIQGQEEAIRVLKGALTSGKPGHAYLFHGAEGVGKTLAATAFAQALNCERGGPEACGECLACRRAAHGNLRDIQVIEPGSKSGQMIEIDQVREVIARASTRPTEGRRKVFLMPQAHRLSPPAMQTLLKTLEEPPEFVTLILETRDLTDLLPTLLSRCQMVRLRPLASEVIGQILKQSGVGDERAKVAAAYSQGSAGRALSLSRDKGEWNRRGQTLDLMAAVARMRRPEALRAAEDLLKIAQSAKDAKSPETDDSTDDGEGAAESAPSGNGAAPEAAAPARAAKRGLSEVMGVVSAWFRDLLVLEASQGNAALRNPDRAAELQAALSAYSSDQLYAALDVVLRADAYLLRNANPRLLMEHLMLSLCPTERRTAS